MPPSADHARRRYDGIVFSDRRRGDDDLGPHRRQLCWSHLLRDFTAHSEGLVEQHDFGSAGLAIANDLFQAWEQFEKTATEPDSRP